MHPFGEANTQANWDELEQLIKDAEMKLEISVGRSGRRKITGGMRHVEKGGLRARILKDEVKRVRSHRKQTWQELYRRDKKF